MRTSQKVLPVSALGAAAVSGGVETRALSLMRELDRFRSAGQAVG